MEYRYVLSGLFQGLIDLLLNSGAGFFVGPFLTLLFVLRFLKWLASYRGRSGPDLETMHDQFDEYRQRAEQIPSRLRGSIRRRY